MKSDGIPIKSPYIGGEFTYPTQILEAWLLPMKSHKIPINPTMWGPQDS
jgi:hypothetical protein